MNNNTLTTEQIKFINTWHLSKEETIRRHKLLEEEVNNWKNTFVTARKITLNKGFKMSYSLCKIMATLRPISDSELINFINGVFMMPLYYRNRNEELGADIDIMTQPALDKFSKYMTSSEKIGLLIDQEVSGDEVLKLGYVEVKLSKKEILLHIKRTMSLPLIPEDISKIQKDLVDYKCKQYLDEKTLALDHLEQESSRMKLFIDKVRPYGFFELKKVTDLTSDGLVKLVELIVTSKTPYAIAMFEHIGFITHLMRAHFPKLQDRDNFISKVLGAHARVIRGNINSLSPNTTENKSRYTSYNNIEKVKIDYQNIK